MKYSGTVQTSVWYAVIPQIGGKIAQGKTEQEVKAKVFDYIQKNIDKITITEIHEITIIKNDKEAK